MSTKSESPKKVTHIRRCHICGTVNEAESSAVHFCHSCGKHLAPFYYFDESKLDGIEVDKLFSSKNKKAKSYRPLWGISCYWQEFNES